MTISVDLAIPPTAAVDFRLRIGAWAALLVALIAPLQVGASLAASSGADPAHSPVYVVVEATRILAVLVAILGLHVLFRSTAERPADVVRAIGIAGAALGLALDGTWLLPLD